MPYMLVPLIESPVGTAKTCFFSLLQKFMPKLLRKVNHKTNWARHGEFTKYVPAGHAPADALTDIPTAGDALSVWEIDDNKTNLNRVLAAIASHREYLQKIDYLIFDLRHLNEIGLVMEQKAGQTHDAHANASWHFDLIRLSASDLSRLANMMFVHAERDRRQPHEVVQLLRESLDSGYVDSAELNPKVREKMLKNN